MNTTTAPLTGARVAVFSAAAFPVGALAVTLGVYLTNYYASHVGIPLAAVGIAFMSIRLIDIVFDPLLGIAIDHTRSRMGKFRPWLALSGPVLVVAAIAMYFPPQGAGIIYLVGWLLVLYLGFSMLTLSQAGWGATLVAEYHQRSSVYGWIQAVGVLGAVGVLLVPGLLTKFWTSIPLHGVPLMGTFVLVSLVIGAGTTIFFAYEPEREPEDKADRFGIRDYLPLAKRPETLRLIWTDLFCTLGPAITAPLYLFFFEQARGYTPNQANYLLLIYILAGLVAPAVWSRVARRFGKHQTISISAICYVIAQSALVSLPSAHPLAMSFAMFTVGFIAGSFGFLVRAMIADVSDEVRLETGKDRTAMLYAFVTSTQKIGGTLSVGVAYVILPMFGFIAKQGVVNSPDALWGLKACYLLPPVICVMIGGLAMWGYKLDEHRHREIRLELAERDMAAAGDPGLDTSGAVPQPEPAR